MDKTDATKECKHKQISPQNHTPNKGFGLTELIRSLRIKSNKKFYFIKQGRLRILWEKIMKISMNSTLINKAPFTKKEGRKRQKKSKKREEKIIVLMYF